MLENTFCYRGKSNKKKLIICDINNSVHSVYNGLELWWFGCDPPQGIPSASIFEEKINKGALREFAPPWAAILLDRNKQKFYFVTDFLGLFNLFYREVGNAIVVGPNSISIALLESTKIDQIGIYEMIFRGNPQRGHTLFSGVECLAPSTLIQVDDIITRDTYWKMPDFAPIKTKDATKMFIEAVRSSVKKHWRNEDVQELTAGRDSMMLLSTYLYLDIPIRTWTFGYENSYDLLGAIERTHHFKVEHQVIPSEFLLELKSKKIFKYVKDYLFASSGMANSLEYWHLVPILNMINGKGTTTGVGGEVFRGFYYQWAGKDFLPRQLAKIILRHGKIMEMMPLPNSILKKEIWYDVNHEIKNEINNALNYSKDYWYNLDVYYLMHRMHHFAGTTFSATKKWRNVRMPLFDPEVVDCLPYLPTEIKKWGNGLSKIVTDENLKGFNNLEELKLSNEIFFDRMKRIQNRILNEMRGTHFREESAKVIRLILAEKEIKKYLDYSDMITSNIYNKNKFLKMIKSIEIGAPIPLFIGSILTAEIAAREVNAIS